MNFSLQQIGTIHAESSEYSIRIKPQYAQALTGLDGFGYLQILWWFSNCDTKEARSRLIEKKPYMYAPDTLGVFATRAPERPNPMALSTVRVTHLDRDSGVIGVFWIDACDKTPVLDIKPYTPSFDRVEIPIVPEWCRHWPRCVEQSGSFDWEKEFCYERR